MTEETKLILMKLDELGHEIRATREIAEKSYVLACKAYDRANEACVRSDAAYDRANSACEIADKSYRLAQKISMILENEISKKIDIIGEGHDYLKNRLEEALNMEKKWEKMELEIIALRLDVNKIKDCIGIA